MCFVDKADNSSDYPDLVDIETYDGKAIDLLAEYENLGLTPYELNELREDAVCLYKENQQLQKQVKQEWLKIIAELIGWADENLTKLIKRGYFLPNNLRGLRLVEYEELKEKLKEMKEL